MLRIMVIGLVNLALTVGVAGAGGIVQGKGVRLEPPDPESAKDSRSTRVYQLPKGKAETLAAFLKELKVAVMETKIQGNKLTVTTTRETQDIVSEIVSLMDGWPAGGKLKISATGPQNGIRGNPITFQITVKNTGKIPLNNGVILQARFDDGLEHETKACPINLAIGPLAPQEAQKRTLILTPLRAGRFKTVISATSEGVKDQTEHVVKVTDSK